MAIRLVLVDDSLETLETLRLQYGLHREFQVSGTATRSEDAFDLVEVLSPDIVSIDVQLASEDGFALCRQLHMKFPHLFLVMCSVESSEDVKEYAERSGASLFLQKPVSYTDIGFVFERYRHRNGSNH